MFVKCIIIFHSDSNREQRSEIKSIFFIYSLFFFCKLNNFNVFNNVESLLKTDNVIKLRPFYI